MKEKKKTRTKKKQNKETEAYSKETSPFIEEEHCLLSLTQAALQKETVHKDKNSHLSLFTSFFFVLKPIKTIQLNVLRCFSLDLFM